MIEQQFFQMVQKKSYFRHHRKILLAISGGLDSMTLFDWLYKYREKLEVEILLAHINHGVRKESDFEEEELKKIAKKLGVKIFTSSFSGNFSENAARQFRYDFFEKVMQEEHYTALVTAHHADDQAETVFMRLLRGARLRHLSGMKAVQSFACGELIRPLFTFHKSDFPDIQHFEDSSNFQNDYLRNRIRNLYLPDLEKENPQFKDSLRYLGKEIEDWQTALSHLTRDLDIENVQVFHQQIPQVQRFLLQNYLENFSGMNLSKQQFEEVLNILRTKANYQHTLKKDYELVKDYQRFEIKKISRKPDLKMDSILLEFENLIEFGHYRFSFGIPLNGENIQKIFVSRETSLTLRFRKEGDSILLNDHHKKLRRLFIDKKVSFEERNSSVVVEQNHQILAILNIAISDLSKALKSDIMSTVLYIQKIDG